MLVACHSCTTPDVNVRDWSTTSMTKDEVVQCFLLSCLLFWMIAEMQRCCTHRSCCKSCCKQQGGRVPCIRGMGKIQPLKSASCSSYLYKVVLLFVCNLLELRGMLKVINVREILRTRILANISWALIPGVVLSKHVVHR